MKLSTFIIGSRPFFSSSEIREAVIKHRDFDPANESIEDADTLLIFKTSTQQSWLVFTSHRVYFVLDDVHYGAPQVLWRQVKEQLVSDDGVIVDLKLEDKTDRTGRVNIGQMNKGFLYSKGLFGDDGIRRQIYETITKQMLGKVLHRG